MLFGHTDLASLQFDQVCSIDNKRVIKHLQTALQTYLNGATILQHWMIL